MQTVLNAFHKKRADPRVKIVLAQEEGNFYLQTFVKKISHEILRCPEYTRTFNHCTVCRNTAFGMEFAPQ